MPNNQMTKLKVVHDLNFVVFTLVGWGIYFIWILSFYAPVRIEINNYLLFQKNRLSSLSRKT
jgi:hypothetical protein